MVLRSPYITSSADGFTFVETLLVIGLLAVLSIIVVPVGLGYVHTYNLVAERDILGNLLTAARTKALTSSNTPYSIYLDNTIYVMFPGSVYNKNSGANEVTAASLSVTRTPIAVVVTFAPISGQTEGEYIVLETAGHSVAIRIHPEGAIEW